MFYFETGSSHASDQQYTSPGCRVHNVNIASKWVSMTSWLQKSRIAGVLGTILWVVTIPRFLCTVATKYYLFGSLPRIEMDSTMLYTESCQDVRVLTRPGRVCWIWVYLWSWMYFIDIVIILISIRHTLTSPIGLPGIISWYSILNCMY